MANTTVTEKVVEFIEGILSENVLELCGEKDCKYEADCQERGTLCLDVIIESLKKRSSH